MDFLKALSLEGFGSVKRLRTKLIAALLTAALLPVFPVYYVVRHLLRQSIEVGYNQNVEAALEAAAGLSRELFNRYRGETLETAEALAKTPWVRRVFRRGEVVHPDTLALDGGHLDFYDLRGKLLNTFTAHPELPFPELFRSTLAPLAGKSSPQIIEAVGGVRFVLAFAPVNLGGNKAGFIVFTRPIETKFQRMFARVVKVNQMFKTLDLFEGGVTSGFILSFLSIYLPIAALSIGLGVYFSGRIIRPLSTLAESTRRVAEGDWETRVPVTTKDEIAEVSTAFNEMVARLQENQEQLIQLEKMAAWREIARVLAHEIKNPLTPMQLMVQQLKDKYGGDDPAYQKLLDECTAIIIDEINTLRNLAREFSDFARMPGLNLETGDLNELLADLAKLYPEVKCEGYGAPLKTRFDYEKMRRVLINLIENSLDSIRQKGGGKVELKLSARENCARLICSDTGMGVPEELQKRIFEPYVSTKKSGMGLGLAIVRRVVTEHGGKITLKSDVGAGAVFTIELPLKT